MIAFILQHSDWIILGIWTALFVGIGFVLGWLYTNYRWAEGILVQLGREEVRRVFKENGQ